MSSNAAVFAEVVVDVPARELGDKLFTYRVPEFLHSETFIGAQVLVPFGGQELVGGYVMAIKDRTSGDFKLKDVVDVLDNDPLFDRDYVEFLYWVAEYYCASLSSVIQAAVPADFGPRLKRMVELVADVREGDEPAACLGTVANDPFAIRVMETLLQAKGKRLALRTARQRSRLNQAHFYRAVALLRQAGVVRIATETANKLAPKLVTTIAWSGEEGITDRQKQVIAVLKRAGGQMPLARLVESTGTTRDTIKRMVAGRLLYQRAEEVLRDPLHRLNALAAEENGQLPDLTNDQSIVLSRLSHELALLLPQPDGGVVDVHIPECSSTNEQVLECESAMVHVPQGSTANDQVLECDVASAQVPECGALSDTPKPFLLHGVTGSGKTEIYLRLIQQALNAGRSVLMLVPEISLTPQLARRLTSRFGHKVAVWHSALSAGERYDTWRRLRAGNVKILLGARSAVLTSMPDLGLIILDEEHDGSYKQSSPSPRYHTRHLALEKARRLGVMVLLGSATPDVGTYHEAVESGRLLTLPERVFKQALPEVHVVDMRHEFACGNRSIFSNRLKVALSQCLARKEQAILLINRRGYANHVFCRACGHVVRCDQCSVSLVFHQVDDLGGADDGRLSCHHCGFTCPSTTVCPSCRSPFLRQYGLGTQRVEHELKKEFPAARLLRLDADVAAKKGAYDLVFDTFSSGGADILIGTQMVAKGLDIPLVTVVGVLAADASFNLPDYRCLERGFQLLTQVSGRAGRGDRAGSVVLQTYDTELPALRLAKDHDYLGFAHEELKIRRELQYPPFSQVIRVVVAGPEPRGVEAACEQLAEELTHFLGEQIPVESVKILGPAPCLIERLRGNFRFHLLVKNLAGEEGRSLVTSFFRTKHLRSELQMAIDVDAFELL